MLGTDLTRTDALTRLPGFPFGDEDRLAGVLQVEHRGVLPLGLPLAQVPLCLPLTRALALGGGLSRR